MNTTYILNKLGLLVGNKPSFLQPKNWAHVVNEFHQSMNGLGESEFGWNNSCQTILTYYDGLLPPASCWHTKKSSFLHVVMNAYENGIGSVPFKLLFAR